MGRNDRVMTLGACAIRALRVIAALAVLAGTAAASPWIDGGRPGPLALQAVQQLAAAAGHGLEPRDYGADALRDEIARARLGPPLDAAAADRLERGLTLAMERYLLHLRHGRVDPHRVNHHFTPPPADVFDAAAALRAALMAGDLAQAERAATPPLAQYGLLREALARQRALTDHPAWQQPLPPLPRAPGARVAKLEPGQPWGGLAALAQRLSALGDLPAAAAAVPLAAVYDAELVAAVKTFQQRHGLLDDGIVGAATLKQLQVAPAARARQIELMLERLRWTPLMQAPRMIVINIPEFVLRAYEVQDGRIRVRQTMRVVVGRALDTRTPLFDEDMRFVEFSPYWNVPPSIARNELVPRLRRDPGHFASQGFEFVGPGGTVSTTLSSAALDGVLAGRLRLRQRPGPRNALGDIKFVFPNREAIYLHHTPATQLFDRSRRDFSHGCIRVEFPEDLAAFVLQDVPGWTDERIRQAMAQGRSTTLALPEPVRVLIAYGTTLVKDGRIYFLDDIYGQDRVLDDALRASSAALQALAHPR